MCSELGVGTARSSGTLKDRAHLLQRFRLTLPLSCRQQAINAEADLPATYPLQGLVRRHPFDKAAIPNPRLASRAQEPSAALLTLALGYIAIADRILRELLKLGLRSPDNVLEGLSLDRP